MTAKLLAVPSVVVGMIMAASVACAQQPSAEQIVDTQFKLAGNQPKTRPSGARGVCVKGMFTPTAEAAALSMAPIFAKPVPVTARFSMGSGNPKISDKAKPAARGLAMRLKYERGESDLVMISAPVFFARTPAQMLGFLEARLPGADGKPDPAKIKAFSDANPETTRQAAWLNARPVPASWAGVDYWAVQAYTLTNAGGATKVMRLKTVAQAGQLGLSDEDLKTKPDMFYADDLKERFAKGPVGFDLVGIVAEAGDALDDSTAEWPEDKRTKVKLGTVSFTAFEADASCDSITFDPINLPKGIAGPAKDPMFEIRSPAYAVSLTRRSQ